MVAITFGRVVLYDIFQDAFLREKEPILVDAQFNLARDLRRSVSLKIDADFGDGTCDRPLARQTQVFLARVLWAEASILVVRNGLAFGLGDQRSLRSLVE